MKYTGERYLTNLDSPETSYEHWHRYLYSTLFCKDKIVLDAACGEGYGSYLLSEYSKKVVAIDIDHDVIKFASRKYMNNNLEFIVGNVNNIPIKGKNIFDLIVSFETIEHINEKNQITLLTEVKRLLKPGGVLIISTPNKSLYTDVLKNKNRFHVKEFYLSEFSDFLRKYFKNVKVMGQKIYSSSYIWDKDKDHGDFVEFELTYKNNRFLPSKNEKKNLYAIAVCSDGKLDKIQHSLLVDTSDRLTNVRDECIAKLHNEISKMETHYAAQLFIDTGKGTSEEQSIIKEISGKEKELEFDVASYEGIEALRFDPLNDMVRLKLEEIVIIDDKNKEHRVLEYTSNYSYRRDKDYTYETNDPIISFKIKGIDNANKIIIRLKYLLLGDEAKTYILTKKNEEISKRLDEFRLKEAVLRERDSIINMLNNKVYESEPHYVAQLFIDTGKGMSESQSIIKEVSGQEEEFEFDISEYSGIERLRFDPVNDYLRLWLKECIVVDGKGMKHRIKEYQTNGFSEKESYYWFETNDPAIYLDVRGINNPRKIIFQLKYVLLGDEAKTYILTKKNEEISKRLDEFRLKEAELQEKDLTIADLNKEISTKEAELQERDSTIEALNKEISTKEAELQKKDSIIAILNEEKRQQLIKLESLQRQLETERLLKEKVLNSKSWKFTAPLRWIYNKVKKIKGNVDLK